MNDSGAVGRPGASVLEAARQRLLVIHDELDLELGDVRASSAEDWRATTGCDRCPTRWARMTSCECASASAGPSPATAAIADWVLQPFALGTDVDAIVSDAADCAQAVIRDGVDEAMRRWNYLAIAGSAGERDRISGLCPTAAEAVRAAGCVTR